MIEVVVSRGREQPRAAQQTDRAIGQPRAQRLVDIGVVTNDEALAMIKDTVKEPSMCAKRLGSEALTRLSGDNVTVLVGFLRGARTCENVSWARAF